MGRDEFHLKYNQYSLNPNYHMIYFHHMSFPGYIGYAVTSTGFPYIVYVILLVESPTNIDADDKQPR